MLVHSLGTDSLASRGVRRHEHRFIVVNTQDGLALERVQNKRVFLQDASKQSRNEVRPGASTKHELYYMNFLCARQDLKCAQTLAAFPTRGFSGLYWSLVGRATCKGDRRFNGTEPDSYDEKNQTSKFRGKPWFIYGIKKISYLMRASFHCLNLLHFHLGHKFCKTRVNQKSVSLQKFKNISCSKPSPYRHLLIWIWTQHWLNISLKTLSAISEC